MGSGGGGGRSFHLYRCSTIGLYAGVLCDAMLCHAMHHLHFGLDSQSGSITMGFRRFARSYVDWNRKTGVSAYLPKLCGMMHCPGSASLATQRGLSMWLPFWPCSVDAPVWTHHKENPVNTMFGLIERLRYNHDIQFSVTHPDIIRQHATNARQTTDNTAQHTNIRPKDGNRRTRVSPVPPLPKEWGSDISSMLRRVARRTKHTLWSCLKLKNVHAGCSIYTSHDETAVGVTNRACGGRQQRSYCINVSNDVQASRTAPANHHVGGVSETVLAR